MKDEAVSRQVQRGNEGNVHHARVAAQERLRPFRQTFGGRHARHCDPPSRVAQSHRVEPSQSIADNPESVATVPDEDNAERERFADLITLRIV